MLLISYASSFSQPRMSDSASDSRGVCLIVSGNMGEIELSLRNLADRCFENVIQKFYLS